MPVNPQEILAHREKYERSVRLRNLNGNIGHLLVDAALEWFHDVKTLEQQLNRLGKKEGPMFQANSSTIQQDLALARTNLRSALWKLPNWLDDDDIMFKNEDLTKDSEHCVMLTKRRDDTEKHTVEDPAFCAGIYDTIGKDNQCCTVTSLGANLLRKLEEILSTSLTREFANPVSRWEVPVSLEHCEEELWNDFFGSSLFKEGNDVESKAVPSAFTMLNKHAGVFTDRELPKAFLLDCIDDTTPPNYKREKRVWTKRLVIRKHLELVVVTGPSFALDTKPCCQRVIANVKETLIILGDSNDLTLKSVSPERLPAAESSAVQFKAPNGDVLATLHNYRTYCTGRLLRHGTTKECLNVTRVVVHTPEILNWMVRIYASSDSICLPSSIFLQDHHLPFIRRIERGKGGKRVIRSITRSGTNSAEPTNGPGFSVAEAEGTALSYSFLPLYKK